MLKTCLMAALLVTLLPMSAQAVEIITDVKNLNNAKPTDAVSIFRRGSGGTRSVLGDTYTGAPLLQDGMSAFFITNPSPTSHTFDEMAEDGGPNNAGPIDSRFEVSEMVETIGNIKRVTVEWTSIDATGNAVPWVDSGVAGPDGPFIDWRLDVGGVAGCCDTIDDPVATYIGGSGMFTPFDSMMVPLGTFAIGAAPPDGSSSLQGVAVVGIGGADIAGLDMASIQMQWDMLVPEPSAMTLLITGCIACLSSRRRLRGARRAA